MGIFDGQSLDFRRLRRDSALGKSARGWGHDRMTIAADNPAKGARALAGRAIGWWLAELRALFEDATRRLDPGARNAVVIEAGERYWILRQRQRPLGQIDRATADAAETRRLLQRAVGAARGRPAIMVEIPRERALVKRVSLPAAAANDIARMMQYEIARHFPFPAERVILRHRTLAGAARHDAIEVELVAVPRDLVEEICHELDAAGLRPRGVSVAGAAGELPLALPGERRARLSRRERLLIVLLAALAAAALAAPIVHDRMARAAAERELRRAGTARPSDRRRPRSERARSRTRGGTAASAGGAAAAGGVAGRADQGGAGRVVAVVARRYRPRDRGRWVVAVGRHDRAGAREKWRLRQHCFPLADHPRSRERARAFSVVRRDRGAAMTIAERSHLARGAALAILAAIIGGLWLGPVAAYRDLVGDGARQLAADQQKLQHYRALVREEPPSATPNDGAILLPAMSDAEGAALLQETLKAAAVGANVAIEGLQVLPPDNLAGAARIGVRLRARGDVAGLDRLLYAIEASRPLLHPDNLQVQSRAQPALEFQLDVSAFKGGPPA